MLFGMSKDDLDELAARGSHARDAVERRRREERAAQIDAWRAQRSAQDEARAESSMSPWGLLRNGFVLAGIAVAIFVPLMLSLSFAPSPIAEHFATGTEGGPIVLGLMAAAMGGVWLFARVMVALGVRANLAWRASLPFAVEGYEMQLGIAPSEQDRRLLLELRFEGSPPDGERLQNILSSDDGRWTVTPGERPRCAREPGLSNREHERNRPVASWFERFVRDQLLPLHAVHPIAAVRFVNPRLEP